MSPKQESEALMNELLPVAKRMLREYGEFFPYGGYMKPSGEIVHVGAEAPTTDRPKSKDLISILQKSFQEMALHNQCKAVAIVFDVVVPLPQSNCKSNAIEVRVDHVENYSAEVFFPYHILNNEVVYGDIFAQEGKHESFTEPGDRSPDGSNHNDSYARSKPYKSGGCIFEGFAAE